MFKRILLTLTFVAALGGAGLCLTDNAEAWRWGYYGPRAYYSYGVPYRTYYRGYYAPQVYSYPYYGASSYYYRPVPRVAVRVGRWW